MMKIILIVLAVLVLLCIISSYASANKKSSYSAKSSRQRSASADYEEIMNRLKNLEKMLDSTDSGSSKASDDRGSLMSQSLDIDPDAKFDLSESLTDDELEILADDTRFFAEEAMGFSGVIKAMVLKLADNVDDGGVVTGSELKQLIDITNEMLEYPLYANGYGRGTPERKTILEKLKKFC